MKRKLSLVFILLFVLSFTQFLAGAHYDVYDGKHDLASENIIMQYGEGEGSITVEYISDWALENFSDEDWFEFENLRREIVAALMNIEFCNFGGHALNCCNERILTEEELEEPVSVEMDIVKSLKDSVVFSSNCIGGKPYYTRERVCVQHHAMTYPGTPPLCRFYWLEYYNCIVHTNIVCIVAIADGPFLAYWFH
ncbi:MAG: hypothetical protein LBC82_02890 [Oscillospiraceae bacterium]|jgi:hypothetical protein|nr:hypothetical protein [Oscillospiraceae bacterium]